MSLPRCLSDPPVAYLERGAPVLVRLGWRGHGPRNVLVERADGTRLVRPFRGLRVPREGSGDSLPRPGQKAPGRPEEHP